MAINEIKLPRFLTTDPEFWFNSVEFLLSIEQTDGNKKYEYIKSLVPNHEYYLEDYEEDEEDEEKYQELRKHVIRRIDQEKVKNMELLALFECCSLRPSAFLTHLSVLMNDSIPKSIKRTFWLARLPRRIQKVVMAAMLKDPVPIEDRSLEGLAAVADSVGAYEKYYSWLSLPAEDAVELPAYNENDLELWLYLVDETFSSKDVTDDETKFKSVMKLLRCSDLLTASLFLTELPNEQANNMYMNLRERLLRTEEIIKRDIVYRVVFRNIENLTPSKFYYFLNGLAAKCYKVISQLAVRTLWIMQLPIKTQAILFQAIITSREHLQDMNIDTLCMIADNASKSKKKMERVSGCLRAVDFKEEDVDIDELDQELEEAKTLQEKLAVGIRRCDVMYRFYYEKVLSESISSCTVYDEEHFEDDLDASDYFLRGCTCYYHHNYGAEAFNCVQVQAKNK